MLIGVISDTHNDFNGIIKAIKFFNLRNTDLVLHCGDICSPSAAKKFAALNSGFKAVYGNNDIDRAELDNAISPFGMISEGPFKFKVSGKLFAMTHSPFSVSSLIAEGNFDYVLYGHTHRPSIEKRGNVAVINPGEACGYRYGRKTVALIDLESGKSEIFEYEFE